MTECNLDHSVEDVKKKLADQSLFLPSSLLKKVELFLEKNLDQDTLNILFHLLKKYDLISAEEQQERNRRLEQVIHSASK